MPYVHVPNTQTLTEDEMDEIAYTWARNYNPSKCTRMLAGACVVQTRMPLRQDELDRVSHPVLIIQPDNSNVHPLENALELQKQLPHGAVLNVVKGGHDVPNFGSRFSPIVNKYFVSFLQSLPPPSACPSTPSATLDNADLRKALVLNSELANDPEMAQKNPLCIWSFSRTPPAIQKMISEQVLPAWLEVERNGRTFLRPDGTMIRKYSERHDHQFATSSLLPSAEPGHDSVDRSLPVAVYYHTAITA
ncbi:hypothetical protein DL93DRAFT_2081792 [Clavulina sp. PMI_390]|nr:hypothetical protein DL93DRAFT_2081792 [Clavulina sp. PMI_390]